MTFLTGLKCHVCGTKFPAEALFVCDQCFGPLEADYDYAAIGKAVGPKAISQRAPNVWRYRELLPISGEPLTGFNSGFTPLVRAERLAKAWGVSELYIKDDSANHPTFSYKDRVVSVAATRAVELGFEVFGCASTGNLGNSVASHAARLGLPCYVFIPDDLEPAKVAGSAIYGPRLIAIRGTYDDVNRLCTQIADKRPWGFANINLRSYYAEGAKTMGFEIVEQLGWTFPRHVVSPVAGGTLLPRIGRAFDEVRRLGWVDDELPKIHAAQAAGCAPVVKALHAGLDHPDPVRPNTIAKAIAIGNPADGFHVLETVRGSGGTGDTATDDEILDGIQTLARTEGIFTEPAGGTTVAVTRKLIEQGAIPRDESIVVCITGNGYKATDVIVDRAVQPVHLGRSLQEFEDYMAGQDAGVPAAEVD